MDTAPGRSEVPHAAVRLAHGPLLVRPVRAVEHAVAEPLHAQTPAVVGARVAVLGAVVDVVPDERYEPDAGVDPAADGLRERLAELIGPADEYVEVFDPYVRGGEIVHSRLSDDIADVAADLYHGLAHFKAGRADEALWWWQYSYLANWGSTASSALRALHSAVAHTRLDAGAEG